MRTAGHNVVQGQVEESKELKSFVRGWSRKEQDICMRRDAEGSAGKFFTCIISLL